ncbi:MAG: site-2 protease family protein [Clostridia bacterium]|nr:site-2 protease family protein [Clostridia bacterium]
MGKLNFSVHPLFFLFGLYFAATGKVFSFLAFTFTAVIHEAGHAFAAEKLGYKLKNVCLMPYGAVISGDVSGLKLRDEIKIVVAGPLINLLLGLSTLALWWIFPETYPYTELMATANFSLFFVNLLPAYPLDGGRLLLAILSLRLKRKTAVKIARATGVALGAGMAGLFVYSLFSTPNLSILFFAFFMIFGALEVRKENAYFAIAESFSLEKIKRGKEVKTLAITADYTLKRLYPLLSDEYLYRLIVYKADKTSTVIEPRELAEIFGTRSPYDRIV